MQFIKSQSYVTFSMTPDELQALHDLIKLANKDCPTLTHIKHIISPHIKQCSPSNKS